MPNAMKADRHSGYILFQVARDVGSKVEKAEKPEVPKFVVDRYSVNHVHPDCSINLFTPHTISPM